MSAPTLGEQLRRASDRLVTPATVITLLVCGTVLVLATGGAAVWAELNGGRGMVVIDTVVKTIGALASLAAAGLLWVGRHQLSRIEVAAAAAAAPAPVREEPAPPAEERTAAAPTVPPTTDSPEDSGEPVVEAPAPVALDDTSLIPVVRPR